MGIKLKNFKRLVIAIAKLHNFCIDERLLANGAQRTQPAQCDEQMIFTPANVAFNRHETMLRDESALEQFDEIAEGYENTWSNNCDRMVREIKALKLTSPGMSSRQHR